MVVRIEADYLIETSLAPAQAAEAMAGEQSSGTFVKLPGETDALKRKSAARVEHVSIVGHADKPALPGASRPAGGDISRAHVTLSWPIDNIGADLLNLLATISGNLFELQQLSGLRLIDLRLPPVFADAYSGPKFGVDGTRKLSGVESGPLIGTIVKPSVGLDPQQTAELVAKLANAGIDFVKDDELQANGPSCPFEDRVDAVMAVINAHADRTGKKVMFAFNLTGEIDEMRRRHDYVLSKGGTCIMASLNSVGMSGMIALGRHTQLPIHAHRNGWGYLSRYPLLGWSYPAWSKLWRLAGADHMHVNGLQNKFCEDDESVIASAKAQLEPMFAHKACTAMPVISSGQTVHQPAETYRRLQSADLIFAAGGGVMAHPDGPEDGVTSLREAWNAAMSGQDISTHAQSHSALARALERYSA